MQSLKTLCPLPLLAALLGAAPLSAAPPVYDQLLAHGGSQMFYLPLPNGPDGATPFAAAAAEINRMVVLPSGQALATTTRTQGGVQQTWLNEIRSNGSLRPIGGVPRNGEYLDEEVLDITFDDRGRLYLLVRNTRPSQALSFVMELDPETAAVLRRASVDGVHGLTKAPGGLWAMFASTLNFLDAETFALGPAVASLATAGAISDLDVDSTGRIYFLWEYLCGPDCPRVGSLDPAEGVVKLESELELPVSTRRLAIDRRCDDTPAARCLQNGRYRAEVSYEGYDGAAGPARVAPARSRDTAIFSFFDPDNWELMVKALDGCAINGHVWVYSSASTDVQYAMTITDTQTGARKVYGNPLGHVAETVTDGQAFSCTP